MVVYSIFSTKTIEKMSSFSRSTSFTRSTSSSRRNFSPLHVGTTRSLSIGSPRVNRTSCVLQWFHLLIVFGSLVSFVAVVGGGYVFVLPSLTQAFHGGDRISNFSNSMVSSCDVAQGSWIMDDKYPLYNASECPFAEQGFNCLANGRRDNSYLKWSWKPKHCDIPRFNVVSILELFRSKRVVFVGDSMGRTQWESLICLLMTGVEDKKSVYEINGNKITKRIRFLGVRFSSFNFTIEFFRSVFLVQHGWMPRHAPKRVRSTLKLDKLDDISNEWINADILIFNTGQWWVPGKLFETYNYMANKTLRIILGLPFNPLMCKMVKNSLKLGMSIPTAYKIALGTWASWVEKMIDTNRTRVFFRTFEPSHWSDKLHRLCNVTQSPMTETKGWDHNIFSHSILEVIDNMTVPITVLHVTSMSAFRSDAHVGVWSDNPSVPDCSHWCLPGVPDVWNEILFAYLLHDEGLKE